MIKFVSNHRNGSPSLSLLWPFFSRRIKACIQKCLSSCSHSLFWLFDIAIKYRDELPENKCVLPDSRPLGRNQARKLHVYVNPLHTEKRSAYLDGLYNTWELVSNVEDPYLNPASLARFGIKCHNLLQESSYDEAPRPCLPRTNLSCPSVHGNIFHGRDEKQGSLGILF
jgi:hypothetical protein